MLPVTLTGFPAPKSTWYFDGKELKSGNETSIDSSETSSRLTIKNLKSTQIGVYSVKAENTAGSDEAQFTTALKGLQHLSDIKPQFASDSNRCCRQR